MRFVFFSLLLLLSGLAVSPAWSATACVTAECHAQIGAIQRPHAPVAAGECDTCHEAAGRQHPGPGSLRLVASGALLCAQCHEQPNATYVHGPVRTGRCDLCHAPHGSDQPGLIALPGNDICFSCHGGIRQTIARAVSQHEPVASGRCWNCHAPHAAEHRPLLQAAYPQASYVKYRAADFALCFECHSAAAFETEYTVSETRFRNGSRNLHWFHLQRPGKARVCRNCHGVHGADQPHLLMKRVPDFGDWDIPLEWVRNGPVATCYVGCHSPKSYGLEQFVP
ncbi:MAG: cytochrome c3 family protein [Desulfuromonadales bacterium]|nr:cytochrome c3 family protein [Desulfuromonadales bacterium]